MNEIFASFALIIVLLILLGRGVWVGLTLAGVAWFGMVWHGIFHRTRCR